MERDTRGAGSYVLVVGAANIDIWGQSERKLRLYDSNPGVLHVSPGGVGRNISHNLRLLDIPTQLISAFGKDPWAKMLTDSCREAGVGIEWSLTDDQLFTSSYLWLSGPEGEMACAVCDDSIVHALTPEYLYARREAFSSAAVVVLDGNLNEESIQAILDIYQGPIFADPVSVHKAKKLRAHLHRIHTFKPNSLEAQALTDCADPRAAARALVQMGVQRVFVSCGADGVIYADAHCCGGVGVPPTRLRSSTGGGDAMMAGLVKAYLEQFNVHECAAYGACCGSIAVESRETIASKLSHRSVIRKLQTWAH